MLIQNTPDFTKRCLEDWPAHYFEIENIAEREKILEERIASDPERIEDRERLKLLHKRFSVKTGAAWADRFMHAWLMLRVLQGQKTNRLNARRQKEQFHAELENLCVLDYPYSPMLQAEWGDFAERYILACADSRNYRTAILGFLPMKDEAIAQKILKEIDDLTGELPDRFGLRTECVQLRKAMLDAYGRMIEHGKDYIRQMIPEGTYTPD